MAITSAICKERTKFTDIEAAIEEADFLSDLTKERHSVIQISNTMIVRKYNYRNKNCMYSTRVNRGVAK